MRQPESSLAKVTRRSFIGRFAVLWGIGSLVGSFFVTMVGNIRFVFPKILYEPPSKFKAGYPSDYAVDQISDRFKKEHHVWLVRTNKGISAFEAVCTHLGCTPVIYREEHSIRCPCHGSVFNMEGDALRGPAPEPLYRLAISLGPDGQIVVDKTNRENRPGQREQPPFILKIKA